jgi:hypothetical protein
MTISAKSIFKMDYRVTEQVLVAQAFQPVLAQAKACGYIFVPKTLPDNTVSTPFNLLKIKGDRIKLTRFMNNGGGYVAQVLVVG